MKNYANLLMVNKNRYYKHLRITEAKFRQIVRHFALDFTASDTAKLTGVSVRSVNAIYIKARRRIALALKADSPLAGAVEVDESYLSTSSGQASARTGSRANGAAVHPETIVFGILKRQGKVYTEIVPNCAKATLQAVIRGKVDPGTWHRGPLRRLARL